MKVISFDPALSCGWCISEIHTNSVELLECGYINIDKQQYTGDMCLNLQESAKVLIKKYDDIEEVVLEDYMFSQSKCQGAQINLFLRGALMMLCRTLNKPYWVAPVSNWKSIIAGRSTPTRECIKYYGKALANKIFIQEALWVRYSIRFPNYSVSEKTKKPIAFRYDIIDATAINIAHAYSVHNIKNVVDSIDHLPDINYKVSKKHYSYDIL